jgi:hypothetical protein
MRMWVEYDPDALRVKIKSLGIFPNDVSKRTRGEVSRITVSRLMKGDSKTCQRDKLEAVTRALGLRLEDVIER